MGSNIFPQGKFFHGIATHDSHDSHEFVILRNCTLVCRALCEIANAVLYQEIDLDIGERDDK
jgi:hypothetical protein